MMLTLHFVSHSRVEGGIYASRSNMPRIELRYAGQLPICCCRYTTNDMIVMFPVSPMVLSCREDLMPSNCKSIPPSYESQAWLSCPRRPSLQQIQIFDKYAFDYASDQPASITALQPVIDWLCADTVICITTSYTLYTLSVGGISTFRYTYLDCRKAFQHASLGRSLDLLTWELLAPFLCFGRQ